MRMKVAWLTQKAEVAFVSGLPNTFVSERLGEKEIFEAFRKKL